MKTVLGVGPKKPRFIIIGEAPGAEETAQGKPFVGTDGKILDSILISSGIRRDECYITNVVKVQCPQSKVKNLHQLGFAIEDFYPSLKEELEGVECDYCIPVGDVALHALTGKEGILKHRGSVYPSIMKAGLTCIPTCHPGFVREMWAARGTVVADLKKAVRVSKGGYTPMTFNTKLSPTLDETVSFLSDLEKVRAVSFDIETVGSGQLACLGVGGVFGGERKSMCIPFKFGFKNYWQESEEMYVWEMIRRLFHNPHILKIGQFITYDLTMLYPFIGIPSPPWFDCNVAHHLLDPELPHTLAYQTSVYTDVNYYKDDPKDEGESWKYMSSSEQLWEYNGKDVEIPLVLEEKMTEEMRGRGVLEFFRGYEMQVVRSLLRLSLRGFRIDEEKRKELLVETVGKIGVAQDRLDTEVGHPLNVNSHKQMAEFVYQDLKLPVQYHRKTRKPTLDKGALDKLAARYPNKSFQDAMELRKMYKVVGTYLNVTPSPDGKVRGKYNPAGTETGRSSCGKTIYGDGLDMQNVPESLRGMFLPSEGKELMIYDCWQAEAYCVAVFSNCKPFLDRLKEGKKIYKLVGSWLFDKPEEEVDDDNGPEGEYGRSKKVTHGADYGLGAGLMSVLLKCPQSQAKYYLEKFHAYAPEIRGTFHAEIQDALTKTRQLTTPFGRKRIFRARYGEDMFREAYSHLPQSTVADFLHQGMVKLDYLLPEGAMMIHEGFDSLVIECYPEQKEEVVRVAGVAFDKELWWKSERFKIPMEVKGGERWK